MSRLSRNEVRELLPLYVIDEVSDSERSEIEIALATDTELAAEADQWREDSGRMLAESAPSLSLDGEEVAALKERLLSELPRATRPDDPVAAPTATASRFERPAASASSENGSSWMLPLAVAASVLSLTVAFWALSGRVSQSDIEQMQAERQALAAELADLKSALARTDREIGRVSLGLKTFGYPRSAPIVLAGLDPAPEALGATFYRPSSNQAIFFAFGLPDLDPSTTYQLWYITDAGPVSAGAFDVDQFGEGQVLVSDLPARAEINLWAVTVEPDGGSPQPTGAMMIRS